MRTPKIPLRVVIDILIFHPLRTKTLRHWLIAELVFMQGMNTDPPTFMASQSIKIGTPSGSKSSIFRTAIGSLR